MAWSDELNLQNTADENINVHFQIAIYIIDGHYTVVSGSLPL